MCRPTLVIATLALAAVARAHDLTGPVSVEAQVGGHFAYELVLTVDAQVMFDFYEIDGLDNTDLGWVIADGFCLIPVEPGTYAIPVEGNLVDPLVPGLVHYEHAFCDGWHGVIETTILPPGVGVEAATWGVVKTLYR